MQAAIELAFHYSVNVMPADASCGLKGICSHG